MSHIQAVQTSIPLQISKHTVSWTVAGCISKKLMLYMEKEDRGREAVVEESSLNQPSASIAMPTSEAGCSCWSRFEVRRKGVVIHQSKMDSIRI